MPELPDVEVYVRRLRALVQGQPLEKVRLASPFVLRTVRPPLAETSGKVLVGVERLAKRIVLELEGELFVVIHLMVAGRLRWRKKGVSVRGRGALGAFDFPDGSILFTEVSKKKRASLHLVQGRAGLVEHQRGGIEPLECSVEDFAEALRRERHTLKRSLTDQRFFSGIGNAYSDEILFEARLSPVKMSTSLDDAEVERLYLATVSVLSEWTQRLLTEVGEGFPDKVTAFREEMTVHGRYGKPCRVCEAPVQRIVRAENEVNYCVNCQTGGKLLADRALSRLLKKDWPKSLDELDARRGKAT